MGVAYNTPIGVYRGPTGYRLQGGTIGAAGAGITAYETWLGRPCTYALDYIYDNVNTTAKFTNGNLGATNNAGTDSGLTVSAWTGAPIGSRTLMLGMPACIGRTTGGVGATTWAQEATGASDTFWTALGNNLIAAGFATAVLRPGREMNGNWYPWSLPVTGDTKAQHAAGWQHIVTLLRGLAGANFKFMWNPVVGSGVGYDFSTAYPGAAFVDYIGIDVYDFGYGNLTAKPYTRTLTQQQSALNTLKTELDGLNGWVNYCKLFSGGVPLAFPEWGLVEWLAGTNYQGGGDNPYFVNQMASSYISGAAMHSFWEDNNMGVFDPDTDTARNLTVPNSRFAFLQDFALPSISGAHAPPPIPVFPAGDGALPTDFNNWVSAPFGFCTAKPALRATQLAGGQSLSASTYTPIQFAAAEDSYGGWSTVATSTQPAFSYLAPYDGVYEITICVAVAVVTTVLEPAVQISGGALYELSTCNGSASDAPIITGSVRVALIGGIDYVRPLAWSSAVATTNSGGRSCTMEIVYVGE